MHQPFHSVQLNFYFGYLKKNLLHMKTLKNHPQSSILNLLLDIFSTAQNCPNTWKYKVHLKLFGALFSYRTFGYKKIKFKTKVCQQLYTVAFKYHGGLIDQSYPVNGALGYKYFQKESYEVPPAYLPGIFFSLCYTNVCSIKFRSKHSTVLILCLLRNLMEQSL